MPDLTDLRERELTTSPGPEVERLEALWQLPPVSPRPKAVRVRTIAGAVDARLGAIVATGWLVFVASVFFQPAPEPGTVTPLWANALIAGFFLALGTAGILGVARGGRLAFGAALVAGILGLGLAVGCMATEHHPGGWWAWELVATGALTALAAAGLRRSRRDR